MLNKSATDKILHIIQKVLIDFGSRSFSVNLFKCNSTVLLFFEKGCVC